MTDQIEALGKVLSRDMTRISTHAENMANANTVGFRARIVGADMAANAQSIDVTSAGKLRATGRLLDVAIIGEGWLVERSRNGELNLTRNGNLHIDADGYLASTSGERIQGTQGDIALLPNERHTIKADGSLSSGNTLAGHLLLVTTPVSAERLPDGRLRVTEIPPAIENTRLAAGVLESANVDIAGEMSRLMMTTRHLESTQRALQMYDSMLANGIGQTGKE